MVCPVRACEYPGCRLTGLRGQMVQLDREAWYCPAHGLLVAASQLVVLHRSTSDTHGTAIREILDETLPGVVFKSRGALTRILGAYAARKL
jgi:hypothetical protein